VSRYSQVRVTKDWKFWSERIQSWENLALKNVECCLQISYWMLTNMRCRGFKRSSTPSTTEYMIQLAVYKPQPVRETQAYQSRKISQRASVTWQPSTLLLFCAALGMMGNPSNTWHAHVVRLTKAFQARLRWLVSIARKQKPTAEKQRLGCILTFKNVVLKLSPRVLVRILTSLIILCPSFLTLMFKEASSCSSLGYSSSKRGDFYSMTLQLEILVLIW